MTEETSIVNRFTTHLRQAVARAFEFAQEYGHEEVTAEHLLYGLATEKGSLSSELLQKSNFPVDLLKQELIRRFQRPYLGKQAVPKLHKQAVQILTKAVRTAQLHEHTYVGTEHTLACLLNMADNRLQELFQIWQINLPELQRQVLVVLKSTSKFPDLTQTLKFLQQNQDDLYEDPQELPMLQTYAQEMTSKSYLADCSPLVDREQEISRLQQILSRRQKNNPLLIGKAGVGKTAIVEGLAQKIFTNKIAPSMRGKRIFSLELSSLVAGTMYRGEFEQRMRLLLDEVKERDDIILFIDEIHTLMGAGSTGQPLDAANILKPALARGDIRLIGATTWDEYQQHLQKDQALNRRFQLISVQEPNKEQTRAILAGVKHSYEKFHQIIITKDAIEAALDLSERYLSHTCWPDKALDLIDEASADILLQAPLSSTQVKKDQLKKKMGKLQKEKLELINNDLYKEAMKLHQKLTGYFETLESLDEKITNRPRLTKKHILQAVALRTGIDQDRLSIKSRPISKTLFKDLRQEIIGQDTALQQLATAIQRGTSPLKPSNKPLGAYLFLGPSGVGKTSTAKSLAKALYGSDQALIRLDMSEFSESFTVSKLIGAPAGYVGYGQSGQLTKAMQAQPLSIVLFDEVEKAHPDVFNLLLQILDDGLLSDGSGKQINFRQSVIILTSNLGLEALEHRLGFNKAGTENQEANKAELRSAAKNFFRTELLNRLDDLIYFEHLGMEQRQAIIKQKIDQINNRLGEEIHLEITTEAMKFLADNDYQKEQGVRSLEKQIRQWVEEPLSESMWKWKKGTTATIDTKDDQIIVCP